MIRRNHIETVTRIDRHSLRCFNPTHIDPSARLQYQKELQTTVDQNFRPISNNKKYHMYKDWKQLHRQRVKPESKNESKYQQPLSQWTINEHMYHKNLAKQKSEEEALKQGRQIEGVQKKNYGEQAANKTLVYRYNTNLEQQQIQKERKEDRGICNREIQSPTNKPHQRYQSTRKVSQRFDNQTLRNHYDHSGSIHKDYQPLFNAPKEQSANKMQDQSLKHRLRSTGKIYDLSAKPNFQEEQAAAPPPHTTSFHCTNYSAEWRQNHANRPTSWGLPAKQINSQQHVADKLKMISKFNDQINDRIKNIIVCFQELRTKI